MEQEAAGREERAGQHRVGREADTGSGNRWKSEPGDMTYEQTVRTLMGLNSRALEMSRSGFRFMLRPQYKSDVLELLLRGRIICDFLVKQSCKKRRVFRLFMSYDNG